MSARSDYHAKVQRIADLQLETAELERKLDSVRTSLESELPAPRRRHTRHSPDRIRHPDRPALFGGLADSADTAATADTADAHPAPPPDLDPDLDPSPEAQADAGQADTPDAGKQGSARFAHPDEQRTEELVSHGRRSTYQRGVRRRRMWLMIGAATAAAAAVTGIIVAVAGPGASWPASVARIQSQAARACANPDVRSEPGQVNFACSQDTRQVLWVFALIGSQGSPSFSDPVTGREGLVPITAAEGGQVATSLNLHHPYNPLNPVDSLAVAARAINSIIAGATVTGSSGRPVVVAGLEADPANCRRYTGSAAVRSRRGFPALCRRPVSSAAGRAALVADIYQKWIVGASPQAAQDAAVLFQNAASPGNPQVQQILAHLRQLAA